MSKSPVFSEEDMKVLREGIEASTPAFLEGSKALAENIIKVTEFMLAAHNLEPLTNREKILLLGSASEISKRMMFMSVGTVAMSQVKKP
jgi:hypothetical protein